MQLRNRCHMGVPHHGELSKYPQNIYGIRFLGANPLNGVASTWLHNLCHVVSIELAY